MGALAPFFVIRDSSFVIPSSFWFRHSDFRSMSFLVPSLLLGVLAAAVPVVIHLLHRQRTTPVPWGAMQFLLESPLRFKRRRKVDHWLLLLARMALLGLLGFLLARPLLIEGKYSPLSGNAATDIAVVVDHSLSSGRK